MPDVNPLRVKCPWCGMPPGENCIQGRVGARTQELRLPVRDAGSHGQRYQAATNATQVQERFDVFAESLIQALESFNQMTAAFDKFNTAYQELVKTTNKENH